MIEYNILIAGEAGQGLVTVGQLLAKSLVRAGYNISVTQDYESRIRGGNNSFEIRISDEDISSPIESVDLLLSLNESGVSKHLSRLKDSSVIICDSSFAVDDKRVLKVDFKSISNLKTLNIAALGILAGVVGLDEEILKKLVDEFFKKKDKVIIDENQLSLKKGRELATRQKFETHLLPEIKGLKNFIMLNGNEAIALGAVASGLRFGAFYPMTPATSIMLSLIQFSNKANLVIEQVEDEISAINMAIGASYAGAKSMVSTSGGGFALMVEGVSLAGMTETPIVIVVAQRPGPATGLPTRTEQADLEMVLHAGHGEFPRAIFAPATIEDCFYLTNKAFYLAEKSQTPVFILTDQFLADSYRSVVPFDLSKLQHLDPMENVMGEGELYNRYVLTDDGVSPRAIPGLSDRLVVADSDEHTEDGHLTEDLDVRVKMVDKRLKKNKILLDNFVEPELYGKTGYEVLFISWGSTKGAVFEAVDRLNEINQKYSALHFVQVWPLPSDRFVKIIDSAKKIISVEGNATAQFARVLRSQTGVEVSERILRYDGLPMTAQYIIDRMKGI